MGVVFGARTPRGAGIEAQNCAAEIVLHAERRIGELTREAPKAKGTQGAGRPSLGGNPREPPKNDVPTLADVGLTKKQSTPRARGRGIANHHQPEPDEKMSLPFFNPISLNSGALATSFVVPGYKRLFGIFATNTNAWIRYVQVFDATSLPADGAIPLFSIPLDSGAATLPRIDFGIYGRTFANGIVVASSTTIGELTIGASDALFDLSVS